MCCPEQAVVEVHGAGLQGFAAAVPAGGQPGSRVLPEGLPALELDDPALGRGSPLLAADQVALAVQPADRVILGEVGCGWTVELAVRPDVGHGPATGPFEA